MARPQAFSIILFSFVCILVGWNNFDKPLSMRSIIFLIGILILWNQLHGGVICAYLILTLILAGSILKRADLTYFTINEKQLLTIIIIPLCTFIFHPHGYRALRHIILYSSTLEFRYFSWINELKPLSTEFLFFWILTDLSLIIVTYILIKRQRPLELSMIVPFIFLATLSHIMVRFLPFFFIFASPYMANVISQNFKKNNGPTEDFFNKHISITTFLSFLVLPVLFHAAPSNKTENNYFSEKQFPVKAISFLKNKYHATGSKLLVEYTAAGYVIWKASHEFKVFIDGRGDLHSGNETLKDYLAITELSSEWQNLLVKYNIDLIIMPTASPLIIKAVSKKWKTLYNDEEFTILEKPVI